MNVAIEIQQAARFARAHFILNQYPDIARAGYEMPEPLPRYLAIEKHDSYSSWALNADTLPGLAREIDQSETERTEIVYYDLDVPDDEPEPLGVATETRVTMFDTAAGPVRVAEAAHTTPIRVFTDRELATVLHALRVQQGGCPNSECDHFDDGHVIPLDADEIDTLCERLNLAPCDVPDRPSKRALKEAVLTALIEAQTEMWRCAGELEQLLDVEIDTTMDLQGFKLSDLT